MNDGTRDFRSEGAEVKGICYLAHGRSIHVQRFANYFAERGWKVDLITYFPARGSDLHPSVTQHILPIFHEYRVMTVPKALAYAKLVEPLIKEIRPSVMHAIEVPSWGVYSAIYSLLTGFRPLIVTCWGFFMAYPRSPIQRMLERLALNRADAVHTVSEDLKRSLVKFGCDGGKITVVPWGVDMNAFNPSIDGSGVRGELSLGISPTVISIRSFTPVYDVASLINAIPVVLKSIPDAKFEILGTGHLEGELKSLARGLGVWDAVRFVGHVPYGEIPRYLRSADIYVSTSIRDGSSSSLKEAMACGLPVIVTDVPSNAEWIEDGWNGHLVPRRNPRQLAERIVDLLHEKEMMRLYADRNHAVARDRLALEKCMDKIEALYEHLTTGSYPAQATWTNAVSRCFR